MPDEPHGPSPALLTLFTQIDAVMAACADLGRQFQTDMDGFMAAMEQGARAFDILATCFESQESEVAVRAVIDRADIRLWPHNGAPTRQFVGLTS